MVFLKGVTFMFAILETGNKQYKVQEGDILEVELLDNNQISKENTINFDSVLLVKDEKLHIGQPFVKNAQVTARVLEEFKARKIIVFKKKAKKRYQKTRGHRQRLHRIQIEKIEIKEAVKETEKPAAKAAVKPAVKPAAEPAVKPAVKPAAKAAAKTVKKAPAKAAKKTTVKASEKKEKKEKVEEKE